MLKRIDISLAGGSFPVSVEFGPPSPTKKYIAAGAEGLGPVKAEITSSPFASLPGETISSKRLPRRNVVLDIRLQPNWAAGDTMKELRDFLYDIAGPLNEVELRCITDDHPTGISLFGVVEDCAPAQFSSVGTVRLSVLCEDPYFVGPQQIISGVFGTSKQITNPGRVDVGFTLTTYPSADRTSIAMQMDNTDTEVLALTLPGTVHTSGKMVTFNTIPRHKNVTLSPAENLLKYATTMEFAYLIPGSNNYLYMSGNSSTDAWQLIFYPKYKAI